MYIQAVVQRVNDDEGRWRERGRERRIVNIVSLFSSCSMSVFLNTMLIDSILQQIKKKIRCEMSPSHGQADRQTSSQWCANQFHQHLTSKHERMFESVWSELISHRFNRSSLSKEDESNYSSSIDQIRSNWIVEYDRWTRKRQTNSCVHEEDKSIERNYVKSFGWSRNNSPFPLLIKVMHW